MANQLIDCSTFFVDDIVFVNIGLDPVLLLNCVVHINANSQRVKMSTEFFKSLIPLLEKKTFRVPKYLYSNEYKVVSVVQCHGSNFLSIKCLLDDQCIQLSEENALRLLHVMEDIQEMIKIKDTETRPKVLLQACEICGSLGSLMPIPKNTELHELEDYLLHIDPTTISDNLPARKPCFVAQLTLYATSQLARGWLAASVVPEVIQIYLYIYYFILKKTILFLV
jgi:hypothetical protein